MTDPALPGRRTAESVDISDDVQLTWAWMLSVESFGATLLRLDRGLRESLDLSGPWFDVLLVLYHAPDRTMATNQLARESSFSSGGFTKVIDRMTARNLLERTPSSTDRRRIDLTLTQQGTQLVEQAIEHQGPTLRAEVVARIGAERFRTLIGIMHDLGQVNPELPDQS